jgi:hypothetical protein
MSRVRFDAQEVAMVPVFFFVNDFCVPLYQTLRRHRETVELARLLCKLFGRRVYTSFGSQNRCQSQRLHRVAVTLVFKYQTLPRHREELDLERLLYKSFGRRLCKFLGRKSRDQHGVNKHSIQRCST